MSLHRRCIRWICELSWHIDGGINTLFFRDDNTQSSGQQLAEDCLSHVYDTWLLACYTSKLPPTCPQWLTYVGLCFHIIWCNAKGVGGREILGTYLNSAFKNTSETEIFPHGTKSLLTSLIITLLFREIKKNVLQCLLSVTVLLLWASWKKWFLSLTKHIDKHDQETRRNSLSAQ